MEETDMLKTTNRTDVFDLATVLRPAAAQQLKEELLKIKELENVNIILPKPRTSPIACFEWDIAPYFGPAMPS